MAIKSVVCSMDYAAYQFCATHSSQFGLNVSVCVATICVALNRCVFVFFTHLCFCADFFLFLPNGKKKKPHQFTSSEQKCPEDWSSRGIPAPCLGNKNISQENMWPFKVADLNHMDAFFLRNFSYTICVYRFRLVENVHVKTFIFGMHCAAHSQWQRKRKQHEKNKFFCSQKKRAEKRMLRMSVCCNQTEKIWEALSVRKTWRWKIEMVKMKIVSAMALRARLSFHYFNVHVAY